MDQPGLATFPMPLHPSHHPALWWLGAGEAERWPQRPHDASLSNGSQCPTSVPRLSHVAASCWVQKQRLAHLGLGIAAWQLPPPVLAPSHSAKWPRRRSKRSAPAMLERPCVGALFRQPPSRPWHGVKWSWTLKPAHRQMGMTKWPLSATGGAGDHSGSWGSGPTMT